MKKIWALLAVLLLAACSHGLPSGLTVGKPAPHPIFGDIYPNPVPKTPAQLLSEFQSCQAQGLGLGCITPNRNGDIIQTLAARTSLSVMEYGAVCDGTTDDTAAINAAASAAVSLGINAIYIPLGKTCKFTGTLTVGVAIYSDPGGGFNGSAAGTAVLKITNDLGAGNCAINFNGPYIENVTILGPGATAGYSKGVAPAQMNGVCNYSTDSSASQAVLRDDYIAGFYSGYWIHTSYGHIFIEQSNLTNNFYGTYIAEEQGDFKLLNSVIGGNTMADLAMAYNSTGLTGGFTIRDSHLGFAPYGIYREPGTDYQNTYGGFLQRGILDNVGFECIGNAAIKDANGGSNYLGSSIVEDIQIKAPGMSWDNGSNCYDNTSLYRLNASVSATCTETTNSAALTGCNTITGIRFGEKCTGTGIAGYSYVVSASGTTINLSNEATGSGSQSITCADDWNYAIDVAGMNGRLELDDGPFPGISPGNSGSIIHSQQCGINGDYGGAVDFKFLSGNPPPAGATAPDMYVTDNQNGTGCLGASTVQFNDFQVGGAPWFYTTIPASSTSVTIGPENLDWFLNDYSGVAPQCTPQNDVGSGNRWWVTTSHPNNNQFDITINLASGAPAGGVFFQCRYSELNLGYLLAQSKKPSIHANSG